MSDSQKSSQDDKFAAFKPAYRFELDEQNAIMKEWCDGSWNRAFALKYVRDFQKTVAPLIGRPWSKMCNLDRYQPAQPEAAEIIIMFLRWSKTNKMSRVAYVIGDTLGRFQAQRIISTSGVEIMSNFFATDDEGIAWLKSMA